MDIMNVLGALVRPEAVANLLTNSAFHQVERNRTYKLHRQGLRTSVVQHAREVSIHVARTCSRQTQRKLQIVVEHLNAARENLRDTVGLENEKVRHRSLP